MSLSHVLDHSYFPSFWNNEIIKNGLKSIGKEKLVGKTLDHTIKLSDSWIDRLILAKNVVLAFKHCKNIKDLIFYPGFMKVVPADKLTINMIKMLCKIIPIGELEKKIEENIVLKSS